MPGKTLLSGALTDKPQPSDLESVLELKLPNSFLLMKISFFESSKKCHEAMFFDEKVENTKNLYKGPG